MPRQLPQPATTVVRMGKPRLWNAKRRIESSRGLSPSSIKELQEDPYSEDWRDLVSPDVSAFVDKYEGRDQTGHPLREMLPEQKVQLLRSPVRYFSRPHNVPKDLRQQMYFPDFTVTLLRTPHLGPQFASFEVPLWFSKLDIKSYLQNLYEVDVNHVRSFVVYQNVERRKPTGKYQRGQLFQPPYKKKMTVQLVDPFVYPAELSKQVLNSVDFEKDKWAKSTIAFVESNRREQEDFVSKPSQKHRVSIAEQARALIQGKKQWQPTWKQLANDVKVMEGRAGVASRSESKQISGSPSIQR